MQWAALADGCAEAISAGGHTMTLADPASPCRLLMATPADEAETWRSYLAGARSVYAGWGVAEALDYAAVVTGSATRFFMAATVADRCVGGVRVQGPYRNAVESHAITEWAGTAGRVAVERAIGERLDAGVVEVKTAWVDPEFEHRAAVARLLGNVAPLILAEAGCRFLLATSAEHSLRAWKAGGGRLDDSVPPAAYPDERYRTRVMWWDAERVFDDASPGASHVMAELLSQFQGAATGVSARLSA